MRIRNQIRSVIAMAMAILMLLPGMALADFINNDVTLVDGQRTKNLDLAIADSVNVSFKLNQENDSSNLSGNCNVNSTRPATFAFISNPAGAEASDITFTTCTGGASTQSASFSAPVGTYDITLNQDGTSVGGITTTAASFRLVVTDSTAPSNTAPTTPGTPTATSPNNGAFTLQWTASTDEENDPVSYTLERKSAASSSWSEVTAGLTGNSYSFNKESEGTWYYRVKASDGTATSGFSTDSTAIKVDRSGPNAPNAAATTDADYNDGSNDWWKGSVTVAFTENGDPNLADGTAGTGVDASTLTASQTFSTTGSHTGSGTVKDKVGNQSTAGTLPVRVDATTPTAQMSCPSGPILYGSTASASWTASDVGSGLATAATGSVALDTASVGNKSAISPAPGDNVSNIGSAATCNYSVQYESSSILQPINTDAMAPRSGFKLNSTIPVKIQLTGAGAGVTNASIGISLAKIGAGTDGTDVILEPTSTAAAHSGSTLRYDSSSNQYIYNLATKPLGTGDFRITLNLGGGKTETATVRIIK